MQKERNRDKPVVTLDMTRAPVVNAEDEQEDEQEDEADDGLACSQRHSQQTNQRDRGDLVLLKVAVNCPRKSRQCAKSLQAVRHILRFILHVNIP